MHPAPSVIIFSVLSGLGFGFLAFVSLGALPVSGWVAFVVWGIGYALAVGGLLAATFHLGNPQRAWRAFSQWRSSWLSREAWVSVGALIACAPMALSDWLGWGLPRGFGLIGAGLSIGTVVCTGMIYAQIRAVPRWNHWLTPVMFVSFALTGGAILSGERMLASVLCLGLAALLMVVFRVGDGQFAARGSSMATATGLGFIGTPAVFELPHTGGNYLMREMIYVVGRKHAQKLRMLALAMAALLPLLILHIFPVHLGIILATIMHLVGAFAARWLFFAEAEHVVGLYYGARG